MRKKVIAAEVCKLLNALYFAVIIIMLLIKLGVISFCIVIGESMEPTLRTGDFLIQMNSKHAPEYGDIVTFHCENLDKILVKRVIGLPGDTIELSGNRVSRNGVPLDEQYAVLGNDEEGETSCAFRVEDGCAFVLGDNRPVSCDSRSDLVGQIPIEDINCCLRLGRHPFAARLVEKTA